MCVSVCVNTGVHKNVGECVCKCVVHDSVCDSHTRSSSLTQIWQCYIYINLIYLAVSGLHQEQSLVMCLLTL